MNNKEYTDQTKIFLYTHSPETQKAIDSGEAIIKSDVPRRPDGKIMELPKPLSLSFTMGELKDLIATGERLDTAEGRMQYLSEKIGLSQDGIEKLSHIAWLNNMATERVYAITSDRFRQTLSGLETINEKIDDLSHYVYQRDMGDLEEKTQKFSGFLESDEQKLSLPRFDITNSNIDDHLSEIAAFLDRHYKELMNGSGDGFLNFRIVSDLLFRFTKVVREYAVLFFYENGKPSKKCLDWIRLIEEISSDKRFQNKVQYYINLETDLSYKDKVHIGRKIRNNIAKLYKTIALDSELALCLPREKYLDKREIFQKLLSSPDKNSEDDPVNLSSLAEL